MVGRNSRTVDLIEPIDVFIHKEGIGHVRLTGSRSIGANLITGKHLEVLENGTKADVTVVGYFQFLSRFTFLGCDKDDTVRSTTTINGGCRSILEDCKGLDIIRVNK